MFRENPLKNKLLAGDRALACWLHLASPIAAEIIALCGFEGALIDLEHGPIDYHDATHLMQAMNGFEISPIIRVPWNDPVEIKRALDIGAEGIMVPSVETAEAAQQVVSACHYPPRGIRGAAHILNRAASYGLAGDAYLETGGKQLLVICQIETRKGVNNLESILAVEGIDMLFIGPNDLSGDISGVGDYGNPEFIAALARAEKLIAASDKWLGGIPRPDDSPRQMLERGYDFVISGSDVLMLRDSALKNLQNNQLPARRKSRG